MQRLTRAVAALAAFAAVTFGAVGCGDDGNRPEPATPLDPQAVAASMARVDAVLDQPEIRALFLLPDEGGPFAAAAAVPAPRPGRLRALGLPRPIARLADALGAPLLLDRGIAPEYRGKTYLFDVTRHQWRPDASRGGAPANGVRLVLGPTIGSPSTPISAILDVEDRGTASEARIYVTLRSPAGAPVLIYDDRSTGEAFTPGFTQSIEGRVIKGAEQLTYAVSMSTTGGLGGVTERASFSWALPSANVSMETGSFARDAAGDSAYTLMRLGGRTIRTVNRFVRDAEVGYLPSDTTSLFLDDRLYAFMIWPEDAQSQSDVRFVRPNGTALPADEQATLMRRDLSMASVGMLFFVPIIIEGWVYGLGLA